MPPLYRASSILAKPLTFFQGRFPRALSTTLCLQLVMLLGLGPVAFSQQTTDNSAAISSGEAVLSLSGKVLDPTRLPVAGARITAREAGTSASFSTLTNQDGQFAIPLAPGSYKLEVAAQGFESIERPVEVSLASAALGEIMLGISPHNEEIFVTETADSRPQFIMSATKTVTPLRDVPQAITVVDKNQIRDQSMQSIADVVRYLPGITSHQGENNRDQVVIRGNSSSADFFVNGVRDDVQYYRDLYNVDRLEALKGPNALMFGRGGAGGVINRVTKKAEFSPLREITLQTGSPVNRRASTDLDQPIGDNLALRLNGMYENSETFRKFGALKRYGVSPSMTLNARPDTQVSLGYEYFRDRRTADRGITSFHGLPADVPIDTFYGNPDESHVNARVDLGTFAVAHQAGKLTLRNRTTFGDYDRGYQNFVPGAATADGTQVTLTSYNNHTWRRNYFTQTDGVTSAQTGSIRHVLLTGLELGRQLSENFRNTGFFNNAATSILVPFNNPTTDVPMNFRQSATDANNHLTTNLAAVYAQDQVELAPRVQLVGGVRFDYFDLTFHNNRTGEELRRIDRLVSPRAGIVVKPIQPVSVYGSYSVTYLPSSGDQFSSLTTITQQVKPERFNNYEVGVKWDANSNFSLTSAVYRLDRTNTRSTDPNDPTRIIQTGSQRTNGFEVGANGTIVRSWKITGGYAYQDAFITSATTAARAGAQVGQVPHNTFSLWNSYQLLRPLTAGVGIINRSKMFAAIDNTVVLPGYTRVDAALFYTLSEMARVQVNVENVLNTTYYTNADSNTNISPGSPRAVRMALTMRF